ncbi:MAG: toxin TcdB middle/N-terminal domain-containing protein, partial [Verrucomicrobiota bacterium]
MREIDYNGSTSSPAIATNCAIIFDLESGNRTDVNSSVIAGSEIITQKRLQNIRVLNHGQLVRRYNLAYIYSPSTGRSLLQTVTEFGSDNTTYLPAHTFGYSVQSSQFTGLYSLPIVSQTTSGDKYGLAPANPDAALMDMNGDGFPDRVARRYSAPYSSFLVQLQDGSSFNSQVAWSPVQEETNDGSILFNTVSSTYTEPLTLWSQSVSSLIDLNGDSLPDRVVRQHYPNGNNIFDHFQVQLNNGDGFNTRDSWSGLASMDPYFTGSIMNDAYAKTWDGEGDLATMIDMNGDGLPDRVMKGSSDGRFDVQINLNGYFSSLVAWNGVTGDGGSYPYAPRDRSAVASGYSYIYSELMDMNGDGLPDRVLTSGVQLNNGHGFNTYQTTWGYSGNPEVVNVSNGAYIWQLIDMNGDGLPDLVGSGGTGSYSVYFNTGHGFTGASATWQNVNTAGDGTAGWNHLQSWDDYGTKVMFIDMNGDGLPDRVERNYNPAWGDRLLVQYNQGPFPDLLVIATNGIGGSAAINYQPSTWYLNPDDTPQKMAFPVYVVSSVTANDGRGNSGTTSYDYRGAYYDPTYREFRGFYLVRETDPLGRTTSSWFHQGGGNSYDGSSAGEYQDDVPKSGMPFAVQTTGSDGQIYSLTMNLVNEVLIYNGGNSLNNVYFPYVQQTLKLDYTGTGYYRATATEYTYYTASGNLASQTDYGEVTGVNIADQSFSGTSGETPPVYHQYTYATLSNSDIINRPATITVSSDAAGNNVLRQTACQYFGATGNLQQKSELVCSSASATTSFTYDNYGNVKTITDPENLVTTINYDATATFPVQKYIGSLTSGFQYDPRSGALLYATNEQGLVTANTYDVFLRITNSAITPNGSPTLWRTRYQYNLGGISGNASLNYVRKMENDPAAASGYHETYTYLDGLGRAIQTRDQSETNGQYRVTDAFYDARGAVMAQTYPLFQASTSFSIPTGSRTCVYTLNDPVGRVWQVNPCATAALNSSGLVTSVSIQTGDSGSPVGPASFSYREGSNPWALCVTNARGKVQKYYLDAFGRTNQIVELLGT